VFFVSVLLSFTLAHAWHTHVDYVVQELFEALKPSIEDAIAIQEQEVALDFIARRGATVGVDKSAYVRVCVRACVCV